MLDKFKKLATTRSNKELRDALAAAINNVEERIEYCKDIDLDLLLINNKIHVRPYHMEPDHILMKKINKLIKKNEDRILQLEVALQELILEL